MENERQVLFDLQSRDRTGMVPYDAIKSWIERAFAGGCGAAGMQYGKFKTQRMPFVRCPNCGGRGGWEDADEGEYVSCLRCQGKGMVASEEEPRPVERRNAAPILTCPACREKAAVEVGKNECGSPTYICRACNKTGFIPWEYQDPKEYN
jgi:hypothetical protein